MTLTTTKKLAYPRWMDLKTAAWYSSIGQKRLKELAGSGVVYGYQDPDDGRNGWIFDRESIDRYRMSHTNKAKTIALEILKGRM
jgi:hypothetical protein